MRSKLSASLVAILAVTMIGAGGLGASASSAQGLLSVRGRPRPSSCAL